MTIIERIVCVLGAIAIVLIFWGAWVRLDTVQIAGPDKVTTERVLTHHSSKVMTELMDVTFIMGIKGA